MTRALANYLLCFFVGSIFTLAGVAVMEHGLLSVNPFGADSLAELGKFVPATGTTVVTIAAFAVGGAVVAGFYGRDLTAFANRAFARSVPVHPHPFETLPSQALRGQADVNAVRDELERQLGRLIVVIAKQLDHSRDHVASLKDANEHLASVTDISELQDVVRSLIAKNETNHAQTRSLEARLNEAQDQVASLRQRLNQAEKLASLDPLTSVANRRRFEQFMSAEVEKSHESGTPLCLILTDIDHFKRVNDTFGHSAGDRVLKAFADLLSDSVRGGDLVARFGGEEFAVVLPSTPMGDAFGIAERIRNIFELNGGPDEALVSEFGRLTASFGVAEIRDGEPPSALIQRADQMLYEAKNNGRNRTQIWSSSLIASQSANSNSYLRARTSDST